MSLSVCSPVSKVRVRKIRQRRVRLGIFVQISRLPAVWGGRLAEHNTRLETKVLSAGGLVYVPYPGSHHGDRERSNLGSQLRVNIHHVILTGQDDPARTPAVPVLDRDLTQSALLDVRVVIVRDR